jgi:hypothetical protein
MYLLSGFTALLLGSTAALAQPAYRMTPLPSLPVPAGAYPVYGSLQGRGMFTGWVTDAGEGEQYIAEPTGFRLVPGVSGVSRVWATTGNSLGDYVGSGDVAGEFRGIVWRNGAPTLTSEWTSGDFGAVDVNERRVFAGGVLNASGAMQAATATLDGTLTLLPSPQNALTAWATGINNGGVVAGGSFTEDGPVPVRWSNGVFEQFVVSPNWQPHAATLTGHVINASGVSAFGFYSDDPAEAGMYLWSLSGVQRIVEGNLAIPLGISDAGDIALFGGGPAQLWSNGQTYASTDLIVDGQAGLDFVIGDIGADGTLLVSFWAPDGATTHALLEVVPSPSGIALGAVAAITMMRRRR